MPPFPLDLVAWGVPPPVAAAYAARGVARLYPWQAAAVASGADGSSLLFAAPTSGGKWWPGGGLVANTGALAALQQSVWEWKTRACQLTPDLSIIANTVRLGCTNTRKLIIIYTR